MGMGRRSETEEGGGGGRGGVKVTLQLGAQDKQTEKYCSLLTKLLDGCSSATSVSILLVFSDELMILTAEIHMWQL